MSAQGTIFAAVNRAANSIVTPLVRSPRLRGVLGRTFTLVTYTGRRSGQTFTTPVAYTRKGSTIDIRVVLPDEKQWWRNFEADGGPISLLLDGVDKSGHAVAERDAKGRQWVHVTLDA